MRKVICHTFVLVAPTEAHGECDAQVIEGVSVSCEFRHAALQQIPSLLAGY